MRAADLPPSSRGPLRLGVRHTYWRGYRGESRPHHVTPRRPVRGDWKEPELCATPRHGHVHSGSASLSQPMRTRGETAGHVTTAALSTSRLSRRGVTRTDSGGTAAAQGSCANDIRGSFRISIFFLHARYGAGDISGVTAPSRLFIHVPGLPP